MIVVGGQQLGGDVCGGGMVGGWAWGAPVQNGHLRCSVCCGFDQFSLGIVRY